MKAARGSALWGACPQEVGGGPQFERHGRTSVQPTPMFARKPIVLRPRIGPNNAPAVMTLTNAQLHAPTRTTAKCEVRTLASFREQASVPNPECPHKGSRAPRGNTRCIIMSGRLLAPPRTKLISTLALDDQSHQTTNEASPHWRAARATQRQRTSL